VYNPPYFTVAIVLSGTATVRAVSKVIMVVGVPDTAMIL
jgi:hypothetical protein